MPDSKAANFRHMELSYKGSERQRPSILQQTLRFQHILEDSSRPITESNILSLVDDWNTQPFVIANKRWQISKLARIAITNLSVSVGRATLDVMTAHLHWWKWTESCAPLAQPCAYSNFKKVVIAHLTRTLGRHNVDDNDVWLPCVFFRCMISRRLGLWVSCKAATECGGQTRVIVSCFHFCDTLPPRGFTETLLQSKRWLTGSRPRCPTSPIWENILTVTDESQLLFMRRVVTSYSAPDEWDKVVDYACVVTKVIETARGTEGLDDTVVDTIKKSFLNGCAKEIQQHSSCVRTVFCCTLHCIKPSHVNVSIEQLEPLARDYFADYDAHVIVKNSQFDFRHLAIWQEIIVPLLHQGPVTSSSLDVEAATELAAEASFREVVAFVAQDERDFLAYQMQATRTKSRQHVLMVTHNRQQLLKGTSSGPQVARSTDFLQQTLFVM